MTTLSALRACTSRTLLLVAALSATLSAADADAPFPFAIPWDDATPSIVDSGALLPLPLAGGPLQIADGRFVDNAGRRVRFLGANIVGPACFPPEDQAPAIARRLRRLGFTCVRLHHMDAHWAKPNIFSLDGGVGTLPGAESLKRLDALIAALAENGVRVDLNLHVARIYGPELGYPAIAEKSDISTHGKAVGFFESGALKLQRDYAKALLDRVNPKRGMRLADDPVLALVELVNEDTLVGLARFLPGLPEPWHGQLVRGWNAFLLKRHGDTAKLLAAWNAGTRPAGADILADGSFATGPGGWVLEQHAPASATIGIEDPAGATDRPPGRVLRVTPVKLDGSGWHLQVHRPALTLAKGETYTLSFAARASANRKLEVQTRLDHAPWTNVGLAESVRLEPAWRRYELTFTTSDAAGPGCRISFTTGDDATEYNLADVTLRPGGGGVALAADQTLEAGTIPLVDVARSPAGKDAAAFLIGLESEFTQGMKQWLRDELRCTAPVSASQASYGGVAGLWRESRMDLVDMHSYWQHPSFPGRSWDANNFRVENTPMVQSPPGGALMGPAMHRVDGKPFMVSEYDHPAPSEYAAETMPLAFAMAARQDWDGVFLFDYLSTNPPGSAESRIGGYFDCAQHPAKLAFLPAAAEMFLNGALPAAEARAVLTLPASAVVDLTAQRAGNAFWRLAGEPDPLGDLLNRRVAARFAEVAKPSVELSATPAAPGAPLASWTGGEQAQVVIAAPRVAGAVGLIRGRTVAAGGLTISADASARNFAAVMLVSRDAKPIASAQRLLLTAVDKAENSGLRWKEDRRSTSDTWKGEALVTGVSGAVEVRTEAKKLTVWALDPKGARGQVVPSTLAGGVLKFRMEAGFKTVWYEVASE